MDDRNATDADDESELPADVVDDAERLTRLERQAIDENERTAYAERRDDLLADHGFTSRVRDDSGAATLVLHPAEWLADGVVRTDRIDDTSRAIEIPLEGADNPDDWDAVDERNRELAREVEAVHGDVHGANAAALADFLGNHYAKPIESATAAELEEFRSEYFVRNAWPSEKQRQVIDDSIRLVFETAGEPVPGFQVQSSSANDGTPRS
ncbi:rnhA operon protein [Halosolutus amylolyticus]|uniref:RnhA operon protein n=1 Tax=Halosolutus amylolyticus TaxID=2932267 RepID=A0ABD5PLS6_9EURY|nr:rnhA operon protein [Halosolutus amylolyticus]